MLLSSFTKSNALLMLLSCSVLALSACDNKEESESAGTETVAAQSLLVRGEVPPISVEGAAQLRKEILGMRIVQDLLRFSQFTKTEIEVSEDFDVQPQNDHYLIRFPSRYDLTMLPGTYDDYKIHITQDFSVKVRPTGDPSVYEVESNLGGAPLMISIENAEGDVENLLTSSYDVAEKCTGLFHMQLEFPVQIRCNVKDFLTTVHLPAFLSASDVNSLDDITFKVADILYSGDMVPDADNLWSGSLGSVLDGLQVMIPGQGVAGSLAKFDVSYDVSGLNPEAYDHFYRDNPVYTKRFETGADAVTPNDIAVSLRAYKDFLETGFEAMTGRMDASEFVLDFAGVTDDPAHVGISEASAHSHISGLSANKGVLEGGYKLQGLDVNLGSPQAIMPSEIIPENMNYALKVQGVPMLALLDKAIEVVEANGVDENSTAMMDPREVSGDLYRALPEFVKILNDANLSAEIKDSYIGNNIWLALVNGTISMNDMAVYKTEGEMELRYYGLDALLQVLQARQQDPDTPLLMQRQLQQIMGSLGMVQMFGQQKKDDQDRLYHSYAFVISPEGKITMNGTDLTQILGMLH